jgi:YD repeat-containing protein
VKEETGTSSPTTRFEYNPVGELLVVREAARNEKKMAYDLLGQRTRLENPDSGLVEFGYEAAGNLISRIDANLRAKGRHHLRLQPQPAHGRSLSQREKGDVHLRRRHRCVGERDRTDPRGGGRRREGDTRVWQAG